MTTVMPAVSYITENVALFHPFGHTPTVILLLIAVRLVSFAEKNCSLI